MNLQNNYDKGIDFIIVSYYKPEFIHLLVSSIKKFVTGIDYTITVVSNEDKTRTESIELFSFYDNDPLVNVIYGYNQLPINERKLVWNTDGVHNDKFGPGSIHHSLGLTLGMKNTNKEFICFLDNDTVFLNNWTEEIIPLLDKYFLISHRFDIDKGPRGIIREMFMIFKRENFAKYNLYPDCTYVDGAGNISKCCYDNNENYLILENSLHNGLLVHKKLLNLSFGEQAFINGKGFFYHLGRGSSRSDEFYKKWIYEVNEYLSKK